MELKFLLILASLFVVSVVSHANASNSHLIKLVTDILESDADENDADSGSQNKINDGGSKSQNLISDGESELKNSQYFIYYNKMKDAESKSQNSIPEGAKQHHVFFFLHKDLHEGKIMSMVSLKTKNPKKILPRKIAESIPFSSKNLSEIFKELSVKDESEEAENIKAALFICELPGIKEEEKYCATSLESMVDFAVSKLGTNIQVISTDAHEQTPNLTYTIERVNKRNKDDKVMVCHLHNYPYAVFQCHIVGKSEAFSVSMVDENGGKIEVVVICHMDTSPWNAEHRAFKYLNVKPGDGPICHFLAENHIVWIRK